MLLLGIWCVLNILQGTFTELANDEAYYWFISKDLALGYFDHPPLFGLLTWLGINTIGESEIGVRFFTILMQPLYLYLFWTVVRTERSTWRSALTYFLIAFSIPQLQLYGWVVTPDTPLLLTTACLLWSYKYYLGSSTDRDKNIATLLLGISIASLAYAKYHGALIVLLLVLSNISLLRQWRFWVAGAIAILLIIPHLMWQADNDWVSFRYHLSDRNGIFAWADVFEYLMNLFVTFNPFIFIPFLIHSYQQKAAEQMGRTLRFVSWGFMGFFLFSTFRGYVQPQWVIVVVFAILYIITRAGDRYPRFQKYLVKVGLICALLFVVFRIFVMSYTGNLIRAEIFGNHAAYEELVQQIEGRPMIFEGHYAQASKMNYYSSGFAFAHPSMYGRSSQYQLMDIDERLYGKSVAVAVSGGIRTTTPKSTVDSMYHYFKIANSMDLYYDTVNFYIPTRRVEISYKGVPSIILTGRPIVIEMEIYNPYSYPIPLAEFRLIAQFRKGRSEWYDVNIPFGLLKELPAGERITMKTELITPQADTGEYKFGLSLQRPPATSWYNSPRQKIHITNPSQKRRY